jgi:hypothetical protein
VAPPLAPKPVSPFGAFFGDLHHLWHPNLYHLLELSLDHVGRQSFVSSTSVSLPGIMTLLFSFVWRRWQLITSLFRRCSILSPLPPARFPTWRMMRWGIVILDHRLITMYVNINYHCKITFFKYDLSVDINWVFSNNQHSNLFKISCLHPIRVYLQGVTKPLNQPCYFCFVPCLIWRNPQCQPFFELGWVERHIEVRLPLMYIKLNIAYVEIITEDLLFQIWYCDENWQSECSCYCLYVIFRI